MNYSECEAMLDNVLSILEGMEEYKISTDKGLWKIIGKELNKVHTRLLLSKTQFPPERIEAIFHVLFPYNMWESIHELLISKKTSEGLSQEIARSADLFEISLRGYPIMRTSACASKFHELAHSPVDDDYPIDGLIPGEVFSNEYGLSFGEQPPAWYDQGEKNPMTLEEIRNGDCIPGYEPTTADNNPADNSPSIFDTENEPYWSEETRANATYSKLRIELAYLVGSNHGRKSNRKTRMRLDELLMTVKNRLRIAHDNLSPKTQLEIFSEITTIMWNTGITTKKELEAAISQFDIAAGRIKEEIAHLIDGNDEEI